MINHNSIGLPLQARKLASHFDSV